MLARRLLLKHNRRRYATSVHLGSTTATLGIRAEDPKRLWERRCPLTPDAVASLTAQGVDVVVQPCNRRVFVDKEFVAVRCFSSCVFKANWLVTQIAD